MVTREQVLDWLRAGAELTLGLRLLLLLYPSLTHFVRLVKAKPQQYKPLLVAKIAAHFSIDTAAFSPARNRTPLREQYPFLSSPSCPAELKILVSDKITAYTNYCEAHTHLFDCTSLKECYLTAKTLIDNYIENIAIHQELEYYKCHGTILGRHPIFEEMRYVNQLRILPLRELVREKKRIETNLWRVTNELIKKSKPHLTTERQMRQNAYQRNLSVINKIIDGYK